MDHSESHSLIDLIKLIESLETQVYAINSSKILLDSSELSRFLSLLKQILTSIHDQSLSNPIQEHNPQVLSNLSNPLPSENNSIVFPSDSFFPEDIQEMISALKNQKS